MTSGTPSDPWRRRPSISESERTRAIASTALVVGAVLGLGGSFAPSAELRGLAWGVDGTALIMASALVRAVAVSGVSVSGRHFTGVGLGALPIP